MKRRQLGKKKNETLRTMTIRNFFNDACSPITTVHRPFYLHAPPHHLLQLPRSDSSEMEIINGGLNNGDRRGNSDGVDDSGDLVVDIYPLSSYYFSSKPAVASKDENETLADRAQRLKSNYDAHGMRICVDAVILVELFKHPHLLLLQSKNCIYKLPGGRLRSDESEIDGLKRKLSNKLSAADDDSYRNQWNVGECIGTWWKSDFETIPYPYLPSSGKNPKECIKLYIVKLPSSKDFIVPKNLKLLAVPLCQLHENRKTYGSIIAGIPELLSRFSINIVDT
ncbi:unnamed protein product [Lactuca saligna]|uniref:Pre-mRNA cleavage factor Im 25 kDa subunit n=1 Tax=Lactuca saligna TaxID=75948 RepID=A0AA35ZIE4_LACSI|nr:unnamed protein product [Lactuca saligna]